MRKIVSQRLMGLDQSEIDQIEQEQKDSIPGLQDDYEETIPAEELDTIGVDDAYQFLEDEIEQPEGEEITHEDERDGNFLIDEDKIESPPVTDEMEEVKEDDIEEDEISDVDRYPVFPSPFQAMEWADDNNEVVRIHYTTLNGHRIVRDVEPHGRFYAPTTHRTIGVTYDDTVNGIRSFILKNIEDFEFLGRKFKDKFIFSP